MKKLLLITIVTGCLVAFKGSAIRHITGRVFANEDKLPIPGATVKIKGSNKGTQTDNQGRYAIDVADGGSLVFSFIGYQAQTLAIGKTDTMDVYLSAANKQLSEVVVTSYGIQHQSEALGYSTAPASPLTGKVSGLAGNSVHAPVVILRGNRSITNFDKKAIPSNPAGFYNGVPADAQDESYKTISENGFSSAKDNPLSTFSVDVDAASYSNVRRFINNGQLPPVDAVRIEEMINYFKYNMHGPVNGEPVGLNTEISSAPWNPKHLLVRIGLRAKSIDMSKLPPSNLVFLLDVSGSMGEPNKLPLVKASMKMLVDQLRPQDRVAIAVYSGQAGLKLASTPGNEKQKIDDAIDELQAGGSTAGGAGIKLAYKIARENFAKNGNNRIIMATDGDFNVGDSSDGDMETLITRERYSNVPLTIMGFGMGNYKDSKMETLADKGNGNYAYIDNLTEARKTLISQYGGTMYMVAKDVKLQVEFNPARVQSYRLVGYEDRLLNKEDFNNDQKDAGDMGSGHNVTAFYEVIPTGVLDEYNSVDPLKYQKGKTAVGNPYSDELMTVKFRYKEPNSDKSKLSVAVIRNQPVSFNSASADFRFASAVAEFGMMLRNSQFRQNSSFGQAIDIAKNARGNDEDGYRAEFVRLAETAKSLAGGNQYLTGK